MSVYTDGRPSNAQACDDSIWVQNNISVQMSQFKIKISVQMCHEKNNVIQSIKCMHLQTQRYKLVNLMTRIIWSHSQITSEHTHKTNAWLWGTTKPLSITSHQICDAAISMFSFEYVAFQNCI